jgi:hypothetical protein
MHGGLYFRSMVDRGSRKVMMRMPIIAETIKGMHFLNTDPTERLYLPAIRKTPVPKGGVNVSAQ